MAETNVILEAAATLAAELAPGAVARDASGAVPHEALAALDTSGVVTVTVPEVDGGPGGGPVALAEVVRRIAVADPAIAQIPQGHFVFVDALVAIGTPEQRARLLGESVVGRGERFGNALAERGALHAQDLKTRLVDGVLTGVKGYATGALSATWIAVSALDETGRLVAAFVRRDDPGVTCDEVWHAMGQRATVSGTVTLAEVAVDPALVLPFATLFEGPQLLGARAQLVHAAIEVGIARAAVDDTAAFLRDKARPFFEPVRRGLIERQSDDPYALHRLGRIGAKVSAAEALLARAAGVLEEIGLVPPDAATAARGSIAVAEAKAFGCDVAVEASTELFAICGTSSADRRLALDRHWRNARTHSVHDPVDWKYHHVGGWLTDGRLPPNHSQL